MAIELPFTLKPINIELLTQELKTAIGANKAAGWSIRDGAIYAVLTDLATESDFPDVTTVYTNHNPNGLTPEQQTTNSALSDRSALKSAADSMIAQIETDISAMPVGSLGSANVILGHTLANLERVVRYLKWTI